MNSNIKRQRAMIRPSFNHEGPNPSGKFAHDAATCQLMESMRNLSEYGFSEIACHLKRIGETLDRIDRRLAKRISLNSRVK